VSPAPEPRPPGRPGVGLPAGYVGRFAPSPTGDLHFGSLIAAVGSFLQARTRHGAWLIRIEDIDPPREVAGSSARILDELGRFGMEPDRAVLYQSSRLPVYEEATQHLLDQGLAYPCGCSRADLEPGGRYPGTCRDGLAPDKRPRSVRVRVPDRDVSFQDAVHGAVSTNLWRHGGDFVIRRADGLPAYQLAVVVDDAAQGVTEVVRGADLLDSTPRQRHLQTLLGLPAPAWLHLPLATRPDGRKLIKRDGDDPLACAGPADALGAALRFLGQPAPGIGALDELWDWALAHWDPARIPRTAAPLTGASP